MKNVGGVYCKTILENACNLTTATVNGLSPEHRRLLEAAVMLRWHVLPNPENALSVVNKMTDGSNDGE